MHPKGTSYRAPASVFHTRSLYSQPLPTFRNDLGEKYGLGRKTVVIQICGPGCVNCEKAAKVVQDAVAEAGVDAEILKVTDFAEMAKLGVLSTPAIVVNGQVKCVGKVPTRNEVMGWLK